MGNARDLQDYDSRLIGHPDLRNPGPDVWIRQRRVLHANQVGTLTAISATDYTGQVAQEQAKASILKSMWRKLHATKITQIQTGPDDEKLSCTTNINCLKS